MIQQTRRNLEDLEEETEKRKSSEGSTSYLWSGGGGRMWAEPNSSFQLLNGGLCPPSPSFPSFSESMEAKTPG